MIDREYHTYLKLERGLSDNSVTAYELDFKRLKSYMDEHHIDVIHASFDDLQSFVFGNREFVLMYAYEQR